MNRRHTGDLETRIGQWLDESVEHLDGPTLSRLNQARHRALEAARERDTRWRQWAVPAGALAMLLVVALIWWPQPGPGPAEAPPALMDDMDILASADSLEMLEELEFFMWLEEANGDAG